MTAAKPDKKQMFMSFLFWFSLFYLILFFVGKGFGDKDNAVVSGQEVVVKMNKDSYALGNLPLVTVENESAKPITFTSPCENDGATLQIVSFGDATNVACEGNDVAGFSLEAGASHTFNLSENTNDWFAESGQYKLQFTFEQGEENLEATSEVFEFKKPGVFRQLFRALISKPLFNTLVYLVHVLPHHSLGLAIIGLTLIVRLILFFPNQKAMSSQRELQKLQPKLNELKEKHKGNQQLIAQKTMELYKTHKINPMSSCWPILLQMPFLIGLYQIIQEGLAPHMEYFLYQFQKGIDLSVVDTMFLGLDLSVPNKWILPFLVGGAQFLAFRMSMVRQQKKQKKEGKVAKKGDNPMADQMAQMGKTMQWMMPIMIGIFTMILPAGVGIYWITSTVFGIGQQWLVNHQLDKPKVVRKL